MASPEARGSYGKLASAFVLQFNIPFNFYLAQDHLDRTSKRLWEQVSSMSHVAESGLDEGP